jgi:predicted RND superfamily exporter protein
MTTPAKHSESFSVIGDLNDFNRKSGNIVERVIFNHRAVIVVICAVLTVLLGYRAAFLPVSAAFDESLPQHSPYIANYLANETSLRGLGSTLKVVVANRKGTIYDAAYLDTLRKVNDAVFLVPGVDRSFMRSIWLPAVRWTEVTAAGFDGGPVMPSDYDGTPDSIQKLRFNIMRAGLVGTLVANDQRSCMISIPLLSRYGESGKPVDNAAVRDAVEAIRAQYSSAGVQIYVVGYAELVGDLIRDLDRMILFFGVAGLIVTAILYFYTRCLRSTALVITCSAIAVLWQLGLVQLIGGVLDPYSILVPFLIFAIGVSHGAQKMNGIMQDVGRGTNRYIAARYTFRRLFLAGVTALLADATGFAVLMVIDVPVIRHLAIAASIGVAVLVFTNLLLLPIFLSYVGVNKDAALRSLKEDDEHWFARFLLPFTQKRYATAALVLAGVVAVGGLLVRQHLQIGDVAAGAPELRPNSQYNRDLRYISSVYNNTSDQFAVIVTAPPGEVADFQSLTEMDRLEQKLLALPGVQSTESISDLTRAYTAGDFEADPRWMTINRSESITANTMSNVASARPELVNDDRTIAPLVVYLSDHRADTLTRVVQATEAFAREHDSPHIEFKLAAGSAGIQAATNIVVKQANLTMLFLVYGVVAALCYLTFRSWRAVIVALIPLAITSILCEALMVVLGIGVKIDTLPVTALGVGIGVDYALYLLSVQLTLQRHGHSFEDSFKGALNFTGKVVGLIGFTLAAAVGTWAWSPIQFQADMGILLGFMFLWNMVGALVLIPSLSYFLLNPKPAAAPEAGADAAA